MRMFQGEECYCAFWTCRRAIRKFHHKCPEYRKAVKYMKRFFDEHVWEIALIICSIAFVCSFLTENCCGLPEQWSKESIFVCAGSFISVLAFYAMWATLKTQQEELSSQKDEQALNEFHHELENACERLRKLQVRMPIVDEGDIPYYLIGYNQKEAFSKISGKLYMYNIPMPGKLMIRGYLPNMEEWNQYYSKLGLLRNRTIGSLELVEFSSYYVHRYLVFFVNFYEKNYSNIAAGIARDEKVEADWKALLYATQILFDLFNHFRPIKCSAMMTVDSLISHKRIFKACDYEKYKWRVLWSFPVEFLALTGCDVWWGADALEDETKLLIEREIRHHAACEFFREENGKLQKAFRFIIVRSLTSLDETQEATRKIILHALDIYNGKLVYNDETDEVEYAI